MRPEHFETYLYSVNTAFSPDLLVTGEMHDFSDGLRGNGEAAACMRISHIGNDGRKWAVPGAKVLYQ